MKVRIPTNLSGLLEKINEKNFHYIFIGALLLIFLLYYFVLIRPQLNALWKIEPEIKTLTGNIKKAKDDTNNLQGYKNSVPNLQKSLRTLQAKVRQKHEVPIILEKVSRLANKNNIKINQISPVSMDPDVLLEDNQRVYYSLPIDINADGSYHDFGRFLNDLENDEISFRTAAFVVTAQSTSRLHKIKMTINSILYEKAKTGKFSLEDFVPIPNIILNNLMAFKWIECGAPLLPLNATLQVSIFTPRKTANGSMMNVVVAFDHRPLDARIINKFLGALKRQIENPRL